ncbi:MAG: helix-turn-helix domain-containing protein [Symploca sp. SIO2G7]|nr:helix-turn-helix domain-containing protein [Symploca sp. SIO2G7]
MSQLGAYLQEKRQEQGKSLEEISLKTYIRAQLLKALESGDSSDLPQPIFVQGFIRRYADALGIDGTNFAKQFPVHSIPDIPRPIAQPAAPVGISYQTTAHNLPGQNSQSRVEPPPMETAPTDGVDSSEQGATKLMADTPEPGSAASALSEKIAAKKSDTAALRDVAVESDPISDNKPTTPGFNHGEGGVSSGSVSSQPSSSFTLASASSDASSPLGAMPMGTAMESSLSSRSAPSWLPWGIGAAVLVGAIALIGPRIIGGGSSQQTEQETSASQPVPTEQQETTTQIAPPAPEPEPTASSAPVSLQVEITEAGPSWMSITVDDEVVFEGLLDPGAKESWEGQKSITMNIGNAGAALISTNGSDPVPAGNPGGAEFLRFTPSNSAAE